MGWLERAGLLGILLAVGLLLGTVGWSRVFPSTPVEELVARQPPTRWSPGRSALELPYQPYDEGTRLADARPLLIALYEPGVKEHPLHSVAVAHFHMLRREKGDLEHALRALRNPDSSLHWNERALVLLAHGRVLQALDAVERALALDSSPAALFNKALLLQRLHLIGEAEKAWNQFLASEGSGPWADEARAHLAGLSRAIRPEPNLEKDSQELNLRFLALRSERELEELLADPGTRRVLDALERMGDTLFHSEIEYLKKLGPRWPERVAAASRYRRNRASTIAGTITRTALDRERNVDDPLLAVRYTHLAAFDAVQRWEQEAGRQYLEELRDLCERYGCKEEAILVASDLGSLLYLQGDLQGAERAFQQALAELPEGYLRRRAELVGKLAEIAAATEAPSRAEMLRLQALELAAHSGDSSVLSRLILSLAHTAQQQGMDAVALNLLQEARTLALQEGFSRVAQQAGLISARSFLLLDRIDDAIQQLEKVADEARSAELPVVVQGQALELAQVRLAQKRPSDALELARQVLAEANDDLTPAKVILDALEVEAQALLALGDEEGALRSLSRGLEESERMVAKAPSPLAAKRMEARDASIRMQLARIHAERGQGDDAWIALAETGPRPLDPDECLIGVLADGEGALFSTAAGTTFAPGEPMPVVGPGRCAEGTRRVLLLDRPSTKPARLSRHLRIHHPELAVVHVQRPQARWPDDRIAGPALVVHSPRPVMSDRGLSFLMHAPREAALVRETFGGFSELKEEEATPARVVASATGAGLLHFAVHGEARQGIGGGSYLQLAGPEGRLQVVDILGMQLGGKPLVVLSACKTGGEVTEREYDGAGLPWAFLHAGARAVIAYQDALLDEVGFEFSRAFYAGLGSGAGLSESFEAAVHSIRSAYGPDAAAAFVLAI